MGAPVKKAIEATGGSESTLDRVNEWLQSQGHSRINQQTFSIQMSRYRRENPVAAAAPRPPEEVGQPVRPAAPRYARIAECLGLPHEAVEPVFGGLILVHELVKQVGSVEQARRLVEAYGEMFQDIQAN